MNFLLQTVDKKIVHDFGFALTQSKDYINWVSDYYAMTVIGTVFPIESEESAKMASEDKDYVATCKITWEE